MTHSSRIVLMAFALLTAVALRSEAADQGGVNAGAFGVLGGGMAGLYVGLLDSPNVQKELNLSDDQKAKISEAVNKLRARMGQMRPDLAELSQEERQAELMKTRSETQAQTEKTKKTIAEVLQPKQRGRLREIALQVVGVRAIFDEEVQKSLKLSRDQVAKIKTICDDSRKEIEELRSEGFNVDKFQELNKECERQLEDVLTAAQKAALEKMKGDKRDIPAG